MPNSMNNDWDYLGDFVEQSILVDVGKTVCITWRLVKSCIGGSCESMAGGMFIVKPCSTRAAFEGILKRQAKLDLTNYSKVLVDRGYELIAVTDYVIVAKKEYEFTVFPSGRVLVKDVDDPNLAKALIERLYGDLDLHEH